MKILALDEIKLILSTLDPLPLIEQGFVEYSQGLVTVPPIGELVMDKGEVHIKYGCVKGGDYYTIKIASGFYHNAELGLSSGNGLMLLFSQETGAPVCTLYDEAYLTDIRTAVAGAIAAKYLAPKDVSAIGIIGTGMQARLQALYLKDITPCRDIIVWGRDAHKAALYKQDMVQQGFTVRIAQTISDVMASANLIVTTTPAKSPLIKAQDIRPGVHITAVGSDTVDKQEVEAEVLAMADMIVADSISQCLERGEIFQALKEKQIEVSDVVELGDVIARNAGRSNANQITIADLTGVAVQDIKIAEAIYLASL
jgi:ornithine cyclodeaminase